MSFFIGPALYLFMAQIIGYFTVDDFQFDNLNHIKYLLLNIWLPWVFLSPVILFLSLRLSITPNNWPRQTALHLLLLILVSLMHATLAGVYFYIFDITSDTADPLLLRQHIGKQFFNDTFFLLNAIIYIIFITSFNVKSFYQLALDNQQEAAELSRQLSDAKLHALRMQVNPHFLFNTLNSISVLVLKEENQKAREMIGHLSRFFRYTLTEPEQQWVPLEYELNMLDGYLMIESIRFSDKLKVEKHYDPAAMKTPVPALILQPIVENALKHGLEALENTVGLLSIHSQISQGTLIITIGDNGVGFYEEQQLELGVGLSNVKKRLQQTYRDAYDFRIDNKAQGVEVILELPMQPHKPLNNE